MKLFYRLKTFLRSDIRKTVRAHVLILLILFPILSGCSDSQKNADVAKIPDPVQACGQLTVAEVEAMLGGPVDEPRNTFKEQKSPKHWVSMCNYDSQAGAIGLGITVMPHSKTGKGQKALADHEAELKAALGPDYILESVSGIGDAAGWDASSKQLTIFKGPYLVIVALVSPNVSPSGALTLSKQISDKFLAGFPAK